VFRRERRTSDWPGTGEVASGDCTIATRLADTEIMPSENQHDTTAFLQRALAWLAPHGVTVERVMTDNGSACRSQLIAAALGRAGLRRGGTRPYTPRTDGRAEGFILVSRYATLDLFLSSSTRCRP
jgi:hypothetical protein